ncbi:MAG: ECF transporter S component [Eubacterium sp.]|nr:ECF transporter S component [Eubacterium sp.]
MENNNNIQNDNSTGNSKTTNVRVLTVTAMMIAISAVLQYLEFGIPFVPGFIKLDFSDLPALIGSFALGPVSGIIIALGKNLLHCLVSQSATVGELANFILSCAFVVPAGVIYKLKKTRSRALWGSVVGAVVAALISVPSNYFIVYPFYAAVYMPMDTIIAMYQAIRPSTDSLLEALLVFNLPFTFCKDMIVVVITALVYKRISPILHGRK